MTDSRSLISIDYQTLHAALTRLKPNRILLEIPRWLRYLALDIVGEIQHHSSVDILVSAEDVWGACYFDVDLYSRLNADCLVHIGHAQFCRTGFPIVLVPFVFSATDRLLALVEDAIPRLKYYKTIYIEYGVEFAAHVQTVAARLRRAGISPLYRGDARRPRPTLGCQYDHIPRLAGRDAAILYIADRFYSDGAVAIARLPLFSIEPYLNVFLEYPSVYHDDASRAQRLANLDRLRAAENIGILVESHFGQMRLLQASMYRKAFRRHHQVAEILLVSGITRDKLMSFAAFDIFVNTGCGRDPLAY